MLHSVEMKGRDIYLDGLLMKGVTGFELKRPDTMSSTKLTLTIVVDDSNVILDKGTDDIDSNLSQSIK